MRPLVEEKGDAELERGGGDSLGCKNTKQIRRTNKAFNFILSLRPCPIAHTLTAETNIQRQGGMVYPPRATRVRCYPIRKEHDYYGGYSDVYFGEIMFLRRCSKRLCRRADDSFAYQHDDPKGVVNEDGNARKQQA